MPIEYCPQCGAPRNLTVKAARRDEKGADGRPRKVETRTYLCEVCGISVRSEVLDPAPDA